MKKYICHLFGEFVDVHVVIDTCVVMGKKALCKYGVYTVPVHVIYVFSVTTAIYNKVHLYFEQYIVVILQTLIFNYELYTCWRNMDNITSRVVVSRSKICAILNL